MRIETNTNIDEIDILGRDEFIDNCRLLINTVFNTTKSAFIMIDGEWGVGKTFVMNILDKKLGDAYSIIKYNCWENSYYNDPLEAILSVILDYIDKSSLWSKANREKIKALSMLALNLLTFGGIEKLNKAVDETKDYINQNDKNIYTIIQEVKDYINLNEEKIIILVDEIDRCLPEYGVKTLERLYLLFKDAPNIVIVIANDKSKMEMSVQNVFGYKSIDNYLKKFIDYTLKLDTCEQLKNKELFEQKYFYYLDNFELYGSYWELCNALFSNKDARRIDKLISKANKIHMITFKDYKPEDHILMAELLIVELKELSLMVAIENNKEIEKSHNALYKYINILQSRFQPTHQRNEGARHEYTCFWFLTHIAKSKNNKLNIGYFNLELQHNKDNMERLKKFYELSLIIK